jgi:uncharacterized repeat protein (TIGR01451 family)
MKIVFGKNRTMKWLWSILLAFAVLLPAAPAWAVVATITSAASADQAHPTPVYIGDALRISGACRTSPLDFREEAQYIIYNAGESAQHRLERGDSTAWLDNSQVDLRIGTTALTETIGAKFHVTLYCRGSRGNGFATRYFEVMRKDQPPSVTWGRNAAYINGRSTIHVEVDSAGDGVGKVWIRSSGIGSTEMTKGNGADHKADIDVSNLPEGIQQMAVWAESVHGFNNGWKTAGSFTVDHTNPAIRSDNPVIQYVKDQVSLTANINDASGIANTSVSIRPGNKFFPPFAIMRRNAGDEYAINIDVSKFTEGESQEVSVNAADGAYNWSAYHVLGSFMIDRSPPEIVWDSSTPEYAEYGTTIKVNINDAISGVAKAWIRWTGSTSNIQLLHRPNGGRQYYYPLPTLEEGIKNVEIWAEDAAGNSTGWISKGSITIDRTPPEIQWDAANARITKENRITIRTQIDDTLSGVDEAWIWWTGAALAGGYKIDTHRGASYAYAIDTSHLPDGEQKVMLWSSDKAGNNSGWRSVGSFTIDRTAPVIDWQEPLDLRTLPDGGIHIAGSLMDAHPDYVDIEWRKESQTGAQTEWQIQRITIDDGRGDFQCDMSSLISDVDANYQLRLRAGDKAGNVSAYTASRTIIGQAPEQVLDLQLASMQPEWKYTQGTRFDYRITVSARKWDVSGISLRYILPAGLQSNGAVRVAGDGAAAIHVNPDWNTDGDALLVSAAYRISLKAHNAFTVTVPVRVADDAKAEVSIRSIIEADTDHASGRVRAEHHITLDGRQYPEEQLMLRKTVDKKLALPGETLRYTITFTNVGDGPLESLVIRDRLQSNYLTLKSAQCDPSVPATLRCGLVGEETDVLEWQLDGALAAGDSGSVSYAAQVNRQ